MASSERQEGPTPKGGAYSIAYYQDAEGNPTEKAEAIKVEVVEFDAADSAIFRTYLSLTGESESEGETLLDR